MGQEPSHGICIGARKMTNLRFADDLILCATSFKAAQEMLADLMAEAGKFGFEVHESKTKILWNSHGRGAGTSQTTVREKQFEVLDGHGSTMYLGKLLALKETADVELHNRISKAWAKFGMYKTELSSKCYNIAKRMRLFQTVVQPALLYGCTCWTLTREREQLIRTTQRRMLRKVLGRCQLRSDGQLAEWTSWMIRTTREAEETARNCGVPDFVEEVHRRKFGWAGRLARSEDERWSREVLTWSVTGLRPRKRPLTRWTDSLRKFAGKLYGQEALHNNDAWMALAKDAESWQNLEQDYLNFVI